MKAAIFADVHGNLIALERFLHATLNVVDRYICLGDVVNYGPWNDECLKVVHELPNVTIVEGNHERLFLGTQSLAQEQPLVRDFFRHSQEFFSRRDLISDLPVSCELGTFRCTHTIDGRSLYPDATLQVDRNYMIGHTHHQFRIDRFGCVIVNPGSVGQNRKWIDMVDYIVFDSDGGKVGFHSIDYDFPSFLCELSARRYPQACIEYYAKKTRRNK